MISFSKFKEAVIESGKRILKVEQFGIKTADEVASFGVDSNPLKGMVAIYSDTTNASESVILGYINKNQLADSGEIRLYSLDSNKALKSFIWLKNDNTIEFNGNTYSMVRYEPLESGINAKDNLINIELGKIATAIGSLGGVYTPASVSTNISSAKNEDLKQS